MQTTQDTIGLKSKYIYCDLETTGLDWTKDDILLCGYSVDEKEIKYGVTEELKELLKDERNYLCGHNIKFDALFLARAGCEIKCHIYDTRVLAYLNWPESPSLGLKALVAERLSLQPTELSSILFKPTKKDLPFVEERKEEYFTFSDGKLARKDLLIEYHKEDILNVIRLKKKLDESEWFLEVELPLTKLLFEMEFYGCVLSVDRLNDQLRTISGRNEAALSLLQRLVDSTSSKKGDQEAFNPGSPDQVREVLIQRGYKLEEICEKTAKGAWSVGKAVLKKLAWKGDEFAKALLEYRKLSKLLSTYLVPFKESLDYDGRLHGSINQAGSEDMYGDGADGTNTGRLASSDPNLQNIPSRTKEGKQVRSVFVASPGFYLFDKDLKQIEPRLVAHYTQAPKLLDAYSRGLDTHSLFAKDIFCADGHEPTSMERFIGKSSWLATVYGCSNRKLLTICENFSDDPLHLPIEAYHRCYEELEEDCGSKCWGFCQKCVRAQAGVDYRDIHAKWMFFKNVQDTFRAKNPELFAWREWHIQRTARLGYVVTIGGRKIRIDGLTSKNHRIRSQAERQAVNYLIQGSAADVMKLIMIRAKKELVDTGKGRLFSVVHDELLGEMKDPKDLALINDIMENTVKLRNVRIEADGGLIGSWAEKK